MNPGEIHGGRKVELLAPAGGPDSGYAALHYGADAIYLGLAKFSARADAENFTLDQVSETAGYAHSLVPARRVYVTVNTLVLQRELGELVDCLGALAEIGVDALIVQDLGVAAIARRYFPGLRLHASTQMALHNRQGVEAARDLGFARATLARELTLAEIAEISAVPGIETEVFIHGALCYSYSGLCLFSSQTLGRSGNRGRCAYLCRDQFTLAGKNRNDTKSAKIKAPTPNPSGGGELSRQLPSLEGVGVGSSVELDLSEKTYDLAGAAGFLFSMKDLALADYIPALRRAGVAALKIEGRKKSPLYVTATVNFYRKLLDGALTKEAAAELAADIQTIFSRPWTSLFVASRTNREAIDSVWVGHRGTPIGKVAAVVRSRSGERRLRFRTSRELEIHDGLQIDVPGLPRPYGFAVDWFRIAAPPPGGSAGAGGKTAPDRYRAPAGSLLEVALPPDHPELPRGAAIYCSSSQAIKRRYRFDRPKPGQFRVRPPVAIRVELSPDRLRLQAAAPRPGAQAVETTLAVNGNFPATDNPAGMEQTFRDVFAKLGATPFAAGPLVVSNPGARFVPLSQLNPLRRRLLDDLARRWQAAKGEQLAPIKQAVSIPAISGRARACSSPTSGEAMTRGAADVQSSGEISSGIEPGFFRWSLKTDQLAALELFEPADWAGIDEVIVGICAESGDDLPDRLLRLAEQVGRARVRLALPMIMRSWESGALCALAGKLVQTGWLKWQIANMSGLAWLRNLPAPQGGAIHIAADWPIYVTNLAAARQVLAMEAEYLTLSPEDGLENIRDLLAELGNRAVVIAYQDTPLFISEACAGAAVPDGCAGRKDRCVATLDLKSSFGDRVLALNRRCRTVVINKRPFCLASRFKELAGAGASRLRADFLFRSYPPEQVREIWRRLRAGEPIPGTQLANIDRGLE